MNDLSFHLTDIVANSTRAEATEVRIQIQENSNRIVMDIEDNGVGMDAETLQLARSPFYTTRKTRKVGLGLPFLIQNAEQTGGQVDICSKEGKGTKVTAIFQSDHIDLPPWGDLSGTIAGLITGYPAISLYFSYQYEDEKPFTLSTVEVKEALGDMPISFPKINLWLKEMIHENIM